MSAATDQDKQAELISIEYQLEQHREMLLYYKAANDRMKVVIARLNITSLEMRLAQLRRELGQ